MIVHFRLNHFGLLIECEHVYSAPTCVRPFTAVSFIKKMLKGVNREMSVYLSRLYVLVR
jgi:hypothetical protein